MDYLAMYQSGMSIPEVSAATGIPRSTIRFRLKKLGALRSREEGQAIAAKNGRKGGGVRGRPRVFTAEHCEAIRNSRRRWGDANAKGQSIKPSGYSEYTRGPYKGRLVHVVMMEKHIGRRLYRNECVHHINHDRQDNRIDNLRLMTVSEHARLHARENNDNRQRDDRGRYQ